MTSERFMQSTQRIGGNGREITRLGVLPGHLIALAHTEQCAGNHQPGGSSQRKARTQHQRRQGVQPGNVAGGFGRGFGFLDAPPDPFLKTRRQGRGNACLAQQCAELRVRLADPD